MADAFAGLLAGAGAGVGVAAAIPMEGKKLALTIGLGLVGAALEPLARLSEPWAGRSAALWQLATRIPVMSAKIQVTRPRA